MTKEEVIENLKDILAEATMDENSVCYVTEEDKETLEIAIKALEQNNEEIFKQFKKKVFLESEDVLGNEMVDSYMITDYLAELMGVEND